MYELDAVREYFDFCREVLVTEEIKTINGEKCYLVVLSINQADGFEQTTRYAVNVSSSIVYEYDAFNYEWINLSVR
jgi:hypothetical protein